MSNNRQQQQEDREMNDYRITMAEDGTELETVQAETATEALEVYCADHPDDDTGFQRGGLNVDASTRGEVWATVRTDAGRISAYDEITAEQEDDQPQRKEETRGDQDTRPTNSNKSI